MAKQKTLAELLPKKHENIERPIEIAIDRLKSASSVLMGLRMEETITDCTFKYLNDACIDTLHCLYEIQEELGLK